MLNFLIKALLPNIAILVLQAELSGLDGPAKHRMVKQALIELLANVGLRWLTVTHEAMLDRLIQTIVVQRHLAEEVGKAEPGGGVDTLVTQIASIIGVLK